MTDALPTTAEVRALKQQGLSTTEIAQRFKISRGRVQLLLKGLDIDDVAEERSLAMAIGRLAKETDNSAYQVHLKSHMLIIEEQGFKTKPKCTEYWDALPSEEKYNLIKRAITRYN